VLWAVSESSVAQEVSERSTAESQEAKVVDSVPGQAELRWVTWRCDALRAGACKVRLERAVMLTQALAVPPNKD